MHFVGLHPRVPCIRLVGQHKGQLQLWKLSCILMLQALSGCMMCWRSRSLHRSPAKMMSHGGPGAQEPFSPNRKLGTEADPMLMLASMNLFTQHLSMSLKERPDRS